MPIGDYSELDELRGELPERESPGNNAAFVRSLNDLQGVVVLVDEDGNALPTSGQNITVTGTGSGNVRVDPDTDILVSPTAAELVAANPELGGGGSGGGSVLTEVGLDATPLRVVRATSLNSHIGWTHGKSFAFNGQHYRFCDDTANSTWRTRSRDGSQWEDTVRVQHNSTAGYNKWLSSVCAQSISLTITGISAATNAVACVAHKLVVGQILQFNALAPGADLAANTDYYVRTVVDADHFTIATTAALSGDVDITGNYGACAATSGRFWGILEIVDLSVPANHIDEYLYRKQIIQLSIDNGLTWADWKEMPSGTNLAPCTGTPGADTAQVPTVFSGMARIGADKMGALWGRDTALRTGFVTWTNLFDATGVSSTVVSVAITDVNGERAADNQVWSDGAGTIVIPFRYDFSAQGSICKLSISDDSGATWITSVLYNTPPNHILSTSSLAIGLTPDGLQFVIAGFHRVFDEYGNGEVVFFVADKLGAEGVLDNPLTAGPLFTATIVGSISGKVSGPLNQPTGQGGFSTSGNRMVLSFSAPTDAPDHDAESDIYCIIMDFDPNRVEGPLVTRADVWDARPSDSLFLPQTTTATGIIWQRGVRFLHSFGADYNVYLGYGAGNLTSTLAAGNVGIGGNTLSEVTTAQGVVCIGVGAGDHITTGLGHVAIGTSALAAMAGGSASVAVGQSALQGCVSNECTGIGHRAGESNNIGEGNVFVGAFAAFDILSTGFRCTYVGNRTVASGDDPIYETVIGAEATGSGSNTLTLGRADGSDAVKIPGDVEITHDAKGLILTSPNATRWRITIDNTGTTIATPL